MCHSLWPFLNFFVNISLCILLITFAPKSMSLLSPHILLNFSNVKPNISLNVAFLTFLLPDLASPSSLATTCSLNIGTHLSFKHSKIIPPFDPYSLRSLLSSPPPCCTSQTSERRIWGCFFALFSNLSLTSVWPLPVLQGQGGASQNQWTDDTACCTPKFGRWSRGIWRGVWGLDGGGVVFCSRELGFS